MYSGTQSSPVWRTQEPGTRAPCPDDTCLLLPFSIRVLTKSSCGYSKFLEGGLWRLLLLVNFVQTSRRCCASVQKWYPRVSCVCSYPAKEPEGRGRENNLCILFLHFCFAQIEVLNLFIVKELLFVKIGCFYFFRFSHDF